MGIFFINVYANYREIDYSDSAIFVFILVYKVVSVSTNEEVANFNLQYCLNCITNSFDLQ